MEGLDGGLVELGLIALGTALILVLRSRNVAASQERSEAHGAWARRYDWEHTADGDHPRGYSPRQGGRTGRDSPWSSGNTGTPPDAT
ncbi:hypothetical protein [Halostreptopolyspora alba]|uniref:hypothetical protein n=1 Tax=Halostreptopolyspora alba TaxID=2487137 RepID=UPI0011CDE9C8